ncbi:hypothetical protein O181_033296 [Austropuccinia psidii MF-1]|uniref:Reverse transcriptase Ty1/copia-type domain-containing protein n=1 Tax=Austropuccinia psidii MF-1 TaxID=1389203 RepID=A0A9Q3D465_9BASI|nr:hypothetical protein [Austropuccinia psidii MF-1]
MRQDTVSLPHPVVKNHVSVIPAILPVANIKCSNQQAIGNTSETTLSNAKNNYAYVPYYNQAPRDISHQIDSRNIAEGSSKKSNLPDRVFVADLITYSKPMNNPIESKNWKEAMNLEFYPLTSHNTGELVPYPKNGKVIGGMWRFTKKHNKYGEVYRYKARWVMLGNHQEYLLHYFDTWASVGTNESFKGMVSLVANSNYIPYQFDIEIAFLHGDMDTTVYVKQVKGYETEGMESWVWKLNKSLYGTKQAPQMWQLKLCSTLTKCGMTKAKSDNSLYLNHDKLLILHMHVDNGFLIGRKTPS